MIELTVSFLLATLFAITLSFGYGKKLTDTQAGRPVLGALGFLIVIAGYAWSKRSFDLFGELVFWFIIVCLPVLVAGVIGAVIEQDKREKAHQAQIGALVAQHERERLSRDLEVYSITANDRA